MNLLGYKTQEYKVKLDADKDGGKRKASHLEKETNRLPEVSTPQEWLQELK